MVRDASQLPLAKPCDFAPSDVIAGNGACRAVRARHRECAIEREAKAPVPQQAAALRTTERTSRRRQRLLNATYYYLLNWMSPCIPCSYFNRRLSEPNGDSEIAHSRAALHIAADRIRRCHLRVVRPVMDDEFLR